MTTTCIFDKDGNLLNIGEWDLQLEPAVDGAEPVANNPLPEGAYSEEREVFVDEDGGRYLAKDPLAEAEKWIAKHFSTARLLQMKVWWDTFPHEDTPMLEAVYDWLNGVTIAAAQGQTTFDAPPHSFEELVAEAMFILGVEQP
jgi:hypothetical protein